MILSCVRTDNRIRSSRCVASSRFDNVSEGSRQNRCLVKHTYSQASVLQKIGVWMSILARGILTLHFAGCIKPVDMIIINLELLQTREIRLFN